MISRVKKKNQLQYYINDDFNDLKIKVILLIVYICINFQIRPLMSSANKKLENKKSFIKLSDKQSKQKVHHQKFKTISTDKDKKRSEAASASKTKRANDQIKDLLKQSYMFVKEENQSLANKLRKKMRKIEEMKEIIMQLQNKVQDYQIIVNNYKRERGRSKSGQQSLKSSRKLQDIIKESQQVAKMSLDKYRRIEKQMEQQKSKYQVEIIKLKDANEILKQEISKIKLQNNQYSTYKKKAKSQRKKVDKENQKDLVEQLRILKQKQQKWLIKEQQLKRMLTQINSKINNFEVNCLLTQEKAKKYKAELDHLQGKYDLKCRKSRQANQKWFGIFKQFMKETQNTGKDIQNVKKLLLDILKECLGKYTIKI